MASTDWRQSIGTLLGFLLILSPATALERYPSLTDDHVNDLARVLAPSEQATLRTDLRNFRARTGIQVMLVTLPSYRDYTSHSTFETYCTNLFNHHGIGDRYRNDGVMVLLALRDRQVRIEMGKGYDRSWDSRASNIIYSQMVPQFRENNYRGGLQRGIDALLRELELPTQVSPAPSLGGFWVLLATLATGGAVFGVYQAWVNRKPKCSRCNSQRVTPLVPTPALLEEHLTPAQRLEDSLGSVKYPLFQCQDCHHITVVAHNQIFSSYSRCPRCQNKTVQTTYRTLREATTYSEGEREMTKECKFCNYISVETHIIPRERYTSSDYDSGSSSSDGGSSSGGGASGSW
ncbi:MAG: TPM domain-containing protein [Pseudanabaenaceae cyanobacterium]